HELLQPPYRFCLRVPGKKLVSNSLLRKFSHIYVQLIAKVAPDGTRRLIIKFLFVAVCQVFLGNTKTFSCKLQSPSSLATCDVGCKSFISSSQHDQSRKSKKRNGIQ